MCEYDGLTHWQELNYAARFAIDYIDYYFGEEVTEE